MSRRLVLGLQQALLRAPAELFGAPQAYSLVQPLASVQTVCPLPTHCCLSSRSSYQSQTPQASTLSSPQSSSRDLLIESPQQQDTVPAHQYSYSGRLTAQYDVKLKPVFAVVELGPTQFKVTPDDLVYSEKLKGVDVGDQVSLNRVLLLGNTATTIIGRPLVPGATVTAVVEVKPAAILIAAAAAQKWLCYAGACFTCHDLLQEQFLNGKVLIFKKRRRKNSRRLNGHRQVSPCVLITILPITTTTLEFYIVSLP